MSKGRPKSETSLTELIAIRLSSDEKRMIEELRNKFYVNISKFFRDKITELYMSKQDNTHG